MVKKFVSSTPARPTNGKLPTSQTHSPVTVELTFNALDSWSKETPIIFYSNDSGRSLDKAAYFQAYGFTNARSLDGGIVAWTGKIESSSPQ